MAAYAVGPDQHLGTQRIQGRLPDLAGIHAGSGLRRGGDGLGRGVLSHLFGQRGQIALTDDGGVGGRP